MSLPDARFEARVLLAAADEELRGALHAVLAAGTFDVGLSSADNPVNYRFNPHNAVGSAIDVQIIFGTDWGLDLSLVAREGFKTVESLRGQSIAVDALDSGYAYVLYKILRARGMECTTTSASGSTPRTASVTRSTTCPAFWNVTLRCMAMERSAK